MKISVVTVTLNSEKTLRDTLNSVFSQTYKNIEHIIVDGGSNDETLKILRKYKNKKNKFFIKKNFGIYKIYITESFDIVKLNFSSIILSFIFSYITIAAFLTYLKKANLDIFVLYRVVLGILILIFAYQG